MGQVGGIDHERAGAPSLEILSSKIRLQLLIRTLSAARSTIPTTSNDIQTGRIK